MALTLHGYATSLCTWRVRTVFEEKGVEYELITVDLFNAEQKSEAYVKSLHPFGRIHILINNESGIQVFAIAQYISSKYRGHGINLSPPKSNLKAYAQYQQALSIELSYFDPAVNTIVYENVFKSRRGRGSPDTSAIKSAIDQLDDALQSYERLLSKQSYLAGDEISLADLFHLPYGTKAEPFGLGDLLGKYPAVSKWWNELKARESWIKVDS
ncbi:putative glutathione S-transferase [Talaromyces proteolyticus]|uniref:glutathione transferase n=1 Tax=Talaromyces proteolyticus TaxID=1131652 RepID=A0AAD4KHR7_9EURO|nr:putative glutathione S-transferase [Talaromyces proteolyticus]KAH8688750.1 putative glutathione S-transferase [Talaromyces proteolyticus]